MLPKVFCSHGLKGHFISMLLKPFCCQGVTDHSVAMMPGAILASMLSRTISILCYQGPIYFYVAKGHSLDNDSSNHMVSSLVLVGPSSKRYGLRPPPNYRFIVLLCDL